MQNNDEFLRLAFSDAKPTSDGWYRAPCPFCEHEGHADTKASLALRLDNGWYQCWRCNSKGFAKSLVHDIESDHPWSGAPSSSSGSISARSGFTPDPKPGRAPLPLPDGYIPLGEEPGISSLACAPARAYLEGRGVCAEICRQAKIGTVLSGYYARRIVVPITAGGTCYGWVARSWGKADRKYLYPKGMKRSLLMFNQDVLHAETSEPVVVVEGIFDALKLWPNAVAVLGKPAKTHLGMLLETTRPIAVALDADAQSDSLALTFQLQLHSKNATFIELPPGRYPGDLPADWLKDHIKSAVETSL